MLFLWWWYTNKKEIDYKNHEFTWFFYLQKKYQDYSWYSLAEQRGFEPPRPLTNPSSLANCPLHHLGTPTTIKFKALKYIINPSGFYLAERVGFEPTVRYKRTPIFKTGAINQLDHLSIGCRYVQRQYIY